MGGSVPSSPRPIVSMAEAMRGHLAWKAARDGAAHAQRAKAVSHGMRDDGQDVRLCNIADQMKAAFEESNMRSSGSHDLVHHAGRQ